MTALANMVRAPDGRVIGLRCPFCRVVFANQPGAAMEHADHTWECPDRPPGFLS